MRRCGILGFLDLACLVSSCRSPKDAGAPPHLDLWVVAKRSPRPILRGTSQGFADLRGGACSAPMWRQSQQTLC